jgi:hypothetical protein
VRWDEVPPLSVDFVRADEAIRRRVELIEEVALTTQGKKLLSRGAVHAAYHASSLMCIGGSGNLACVRTVSDTLLNPGQTP